MKMTSIRIPVAVMAAMVFLIFSSIAMADHPGGDVVLKDAAGNTITDVNTPYSPKVTCGCHDYGSGEAHSTHVQGVLDSTDTIYWQAYDIKSYAHGVSASRHTNLGRNETYTNHSRKALGDPFFTSSPGMWGKY